MNLALLFGPGPMLSETMRSTLHTLLAGLATAAALVFAGGVYADQHRAPNQP